MNHRTSPWSSGCFFFAIAAAALAGCGGAEPSSEEASADQALAVKASAKLAFTPSSKAFGSVTVGSASAPTTFTLKNGGTATTGTISIALSGTDASQFRVASDGCSGRTLRAGASCIVGADFAPTAAGARTAKLTARTASGGATAGAALSGTGLEPAALALGPSSQDFGAVPGGASSGDTTFTVTNAGAEPSGALSVSLAGASASEFALDRASCAGVALAGGASCLVRARFAPHAGATGPKSAQLVVSGSPGGSVSASLSGTAAADLVLAPLAGFSGFGSMPLGQASAAVPFTLTNEAGVPVGPIALSTGNPDFLIAAGTSCEGAALGPGTSCVVELVFRPTVAGPETATLVASAAPGVSASYTVSGSGAPAN